VQDINIIELIAFNRWVTAMIEYDAYNTVLQRAGWELSTPFWVYLFIFLREKCFQLSLIP
jgi:hypothetical protein